MHFTCRSMPIMPNNPASTAATMWPKTDSSSEQRPYKTLWLSDPQLEPAACVPEEGTGAYHQLHDHGVGSMRQERIPSEYFKMPAERRDARIFALKEQLGDRLTILGPVSYTHLTLPTILRV